MAVVADFTFGQQLVLDLVGPVTTALLGTLAVGLFAQWITRRAQERRAANDLRNELITAMSLAASRLYMQTRHFGRAKRLNSGVAEEREKLHNQYIRKARGRGGTRATTSRVLRRREPV